MKTVSAVAIALTLIAALAVIFSVADYGDVASREALRAPYRDGIHQGKFMAEHGLSPDAAVGRWTTDEDRTSFAEGYKKGYLETVTANNQNSHAASAAFRDGLFVGTLAVQRGDQTHIPSGRWATDGDRDLFTQGYWQAYSQLGANETARNIHSAGLTNGNTE